MNRREFIAATAPALAAPAIGFGVEAKPVFQQRGYYLCFMRMPTFGLAVWREILHEPTPVRLIPALVNAGQSDVDSWRRP